MLTAFTRSCNMVIVRMLKGKVNEYSLVHYFCIFGITLTVPFLTYNDIVKPTFMDYILFFGIMGIIATSA